jgi:hypothetical protein
MYRVNEKRCQEKNATKKLSVTKVTRACARKNRSPLFQDGLVLEFAVSLDGVDDDFLAGGESYERGLRFQCRIHFLRARASIMKALLMRKERSYGGIR